MCMGLSITKGESSMSQCSILFSLCCGVLVTMGQGCHALSLRDSTIQHPTASDLIEAEEVVTPVQDLDIRSVAVRSQGGTPVPCRPLREEITLATWRERRVVAESAETVVKVLAEDPPVALQNGPTPALVPITPAKASKPVAASVDCLPSQADLQPSIQRNAADALAAELDAMQLQMAEQAEVCERMERRLAEADLQISGLRAEVRHWKGAVESLEAMVLKQHAEDVIVLSELSDRLGRLLSQGDRLDASVETQE